jgi:hypothetical protein
MPRRSWTTCRRPNDQHPAKLLRVPNGATFNCRVDPFADRVASRQTGRRLWAEMDGATSSISARDTRNVANAALTSSVGNLLGNSDGTAQCRSAPRRPLPMRPGLGVPPRTSRWHPSEGRGREVESRRVRYNISINPDRLQTATRTRCCSDFGLRFLRLQFSIDIQRSLGSCFHIK